jgi:hypothetical protein
MTRTKKRYRLLLERLEQRQLLAADMWFEDSAQSLGTNSDGAAFGDLDGDGDLDVLVGCRNWPGGPSCRETQAWLNNGSGQFSKGWSARETNVAGLALGDLDHDGDLDAFVGGASPFGSNNSEVWLNDGQGNFEDRGQRLNDIALNVVLADVDTDGDLDAITALPCCEFEGERDAGKVWLNNGAGEFTHSGQRLVASMDIAMGDVDGDGDLDAYFARGVERSVDLLYLNDGKGNFTDSGQSLDPSFTNSVRLGDLDGDGDLDAFVADGDVGGASQPNRVYLNDGTGKFVDSGQRLGKAISESVELADLDGDGDLDAFVANGVRHWGNVVDQANEIWLNDGSGVFTLGQELGDAASYRVALGDVDGDGDLDAFIGNIGQDNQIWINTQPIQGSVQAVETTVDFQFPTAFQDGSGSGNATHLGRFTVTFEFAVDVRNFTGVGSAHFIAANGDSIFTDVEGLGTDPAVDPVSSIVETHTITGGTGRFAGATGSFTLERLLNTVTGVSSGSFVGWISTPIAGDANRDSVFNQLDIVQILQSAKYQTGQPATWAEGDFNADGVFDQLDIVAALQTGKYGQSS